MSSIGAVQPVAVPHPVDVASTIAPKKDTYGDESRETAAAKTAELKSDKGLNSVA